MDADICGILSVTVKISIHFKDVSFTRLNQQLRCHHHRNHILEFPSLMELDLF